MGPAGSSTSRAGLGERAERAGLSLLTTRQTVDIDVQPTSEVDLVEAIAHAVERAPL